MTGYRIPERTTETIHCITHTYIYTFFNKLARRLVFGLAHIGGVFGYKKAEGNGVTAVVISCFGTQVILGRVKGEVAECVQVTYGIFPGINHTVTFSARLNWRWQLGHCSWVHAVNKKS